MTALAVDSMQDLSYTVQSARSNAFRWYPLIPKRLLCNCRDRCSSCHEMRKNNLTIRPLVVAGVTEDRTRILDRGVCSKNSRQSSPPVSTAEVSWLLRVWGANGKSSEHFFPFQHQNILLLRSWTRSVTMTYMNWAEKHAKIFWEIVILSFSYSR